MLGVSRCHFFAGEYDIGARISRVSVLFITYATTAATAAAAAAAFCIYYSQDEQQCTASEVHEQRAMAPAWQRERLEMKHRYWVVCTQEIPNSCGS